MSTQTPSAITIAKFWFINKWIHSNVLRFLERLVGFGTNYKLMDGTTVAAFSWNNFSYIKLQIAHLHFQHSTCEILLGDYQEIKDQDKIKLYQHRSTNSLWVRQCGATKGRLCPNHTETQLYNEQSTSTKVLNGIYIFLISHIMKIFFIVLSVDAALII